MLSKWIKELTYSIFYQDTEKKPDEILNRIDGLLRRAANETDNEQLHDDIMAEIKDSSV